MTDRTHDHDTDPNDDQEERERSRPDRPTDSDRAHVSERDHGAHAEFIDAPESLEGEPPQGGAGDGETGDDRDDPR